MSPEPVNPATASAPTPAEFRFYGPLNDFLPAVARETTVRRRLDGSPSVKDAIEAIGVPHPEVGLIVANGEPVTFAFRVRNGDRTRDQLIEILERFDLSAAAQPFSRCLCCNGTLEPVERSSVRAEVPPRVFAEQAAFRRCAGCGAIY